MAEKDLEVRDMDGLDDAVMSGAMGSSLIRNNSKIKQERALEIVESAEIKYKRAIEDLVQDIKQLKRDRRGMLDLSPTNAMNLVVASDFDANEFVSSDQKIGRKIRDTEINLKLAEERYTFLFGGK